MTDEPRVRFWIDHGTEVAGLSATDFRIAMRERDMLRRENEWLRAHDKEATDLTIDQAVEIGRLRTEHTYAVADVKQLEAEIGRLRAALEKIADVAQLHDGRAVNIAREALG